MMRLRWISTSGIQLHKLNDYKTPKYLTVLFLQVIFTVTMCASNTRIGHTDLMTTKYKKV